MVEHEKKHGFMDIIKEGFSYISNIISASIVPQIIEGTSMVMKTIDDRILLIEKRIMRKIYALVIIMFGGMFLIFALLFFLIEYLNWSKAIAFFSIGIVIFVIGLLLKIRETDG